MEKQPAEERRRRRRWGRQALDMTWRVVVLLLWLWLLLLLQA